MKRILLCPGLASLLSCIAFGGAPTGAITGKITLPARPGGRIPVEKYTGSISGKVTPPPAPVAGVWLEGPGLAAPAAPPPVTLTQQGYQFTRSLMIVPRGTTVTFPNDDPDYHNVFSLARQAKFDLGRYKKGEANAPAYTFSTCGLVRLQCEIHQHMKANILVVDSPWLTTTAADGGFSFPALPPGTWTLRAQLDEKTQWHAIVSVAPGKTATATLVPGPPPASAQP